MLEFEEARNRWSTAATTKRTKPGDLWPPDGNEHITSGPQTGALREKA
jgi:hypothetical protein